MDDSIIFFQLPTTLPLAKAKRVANVKKEVVDSEEKMDEAGNPFKIESSSSAAKADKKKEPLEKRTEPQTYFYFFHPNHLPTFYSSEMRACRLTNLYIELQADTLERFDISLFYCFKCVLFSSNSIALYTKIREDSFDAGR